MNIVCEAHPQIIFRSQGLQYIQERPTIEPQPVLRGDTDVDASGVAIYGSVILDGGIYRMWYQAWERDPDGVDSCLVGCVESDDGLNWRRPNYGLVEVSGSKNNHLTDLPFHCPSVFIDPDAQGSKRFRAFGYCDPARFKGRFPQKADHRGYFSAYSSDGLHWEFDSPEPTWEGEDVILSAWDPFAHKAIIALKRGRYFRGIIRRTFHYAEWKSGQATEPVTMLMADEYDDVIAQSKGYGSADYYGASLMPTSGPTIGILWKFYHLLPHGGTPGISGPFGQTGGISLALTYQLERGGRWIHFPGRADWVSTQDMPDWASGGLSTAASPIDVGDETRLYFTGGWDRHGYDLWRLENCQEGEAWQGDPNAKSPMCAIGLIRWERNRLLGFRAPLLEKLLLGARSTPGDGKLILNARTSPDGHIRVALSTSLFPEPIAGYGFDDCDVISGDHPEIVVTWKGKSQLPPYQKYRELFAHIEIAKGTLYAFDFTLSC